jgi:hypothetical protein
VVLAVAVQVATVMVAVETLQLLELLILAVQVVVADSVRMELLVVLV